MLSSVGFHTSSKFSKQGTLSRSKHDKISAKDENNRKILFIGNSVTWLPNDKVEPKIEDSIVEGDNKIVFVGHSATWIPTSPSKQIASSFSTSAIRTLNNVQSEKQLKENIKEIKDKLIPKEEKSKQKLLNIDKISRKEKSPVRNSKISKKNLKNTPKIVESVAILDESTKELKIVTKRNENKPELLPLSKEQEQLLDAIKNFNLPKEASDDLILSVPTYKLNKFISTIDPASIKNDIEKIVSEFEDKMATNHVPIDKTKNDEIIMKEKIDKMKENDLALRQKISTLNIKIPKKPILKETNEFTEKQSKQDTLLNEKPKLETKTFKSKAISTDINEESKKIEHTKILKEEPFTSSSKDSDLPKDLQKKIHEIRKYADKMSRNVNLISKDIPKHSKKVESSVIDHKTTEKLQENVLDSLVFNQPKTVNEKQLVFIGNMCYWIPKHEEIGFNNKSDNNSTNQFSPKKLKSNSEDAISQSTNPNTMGNDVLSRIIIKDTRKNPKDLWVSPIVTNNQNKSKSATSGIQNDEKKPNDIMSFAVPAKHIKESIQLKDVESNTLRKSSTQAKENLTDNKTTKKDSKIAFQAAQLEFNSDKYTTIKNEVKPPLKDDNIIMTFEPVRYYPDWTEAKSEKLNNKENVLKKDDKIPQPTRSTSNASKTIKSIKDDTLQPDLKVMSKDQKFESKTSIQAHTQKTKTVFEPKLEKSTNIVKKEQDDSRASKLSQKSNEHSIKAKDDVLKPELTLKQEATKKTSKLNETKDPAINNALNSIDYQGKTIQSSIQMSTDKAKQNILKDHPVNSVLKKRVTENPKIKEEFEKLRKLREAFLNKPLDNFNTEATRPGKIVSDQVASISRSTPKVKSEDKTKTTPPFITPSFSSTWSDSKIKPNLETTKKTEMDVKKPSEESHKADAAEVERQGSLENEKVKEKITKPSVEVKEAKISINSSSSKTEQKKDIKSDSVVKGISNAEVEANGITKFKPNEAINVITTAKVSSFIPENEKQYVKPQGKISKPFSNLKSDEVKSANKIADPKVESLTTKPNSPSTGFVLIDPKTNESAKIATPLKEKEGFLKIKNLEENKTIKKSVEQIKRQTQQKRDQYEETTKPIILGPPKSTDSKSSNAAKFVLVNSINQTYSTAEPLIDKNSLDSKPQLKTQTDYRIQPKLDLNKQNIKSKIESTKINEKEAIIKTELQKNSEAQQVIKSTTEDVKSDETQNKAKMTQQPEKQINSQDTMKPATVKSSEEIPVTKDISTVNGAKNKNAIVKTELQKTSEIKQDLDKTRVEKSKSTTEDVKSNETQNIAHITQRPQTQTCSQDTSKSATAKSSKPKPVIKEISIANEAKDKEAIVKTELQKTSEAKQDLDKTRLEKSKSIAQNKKSNETQNKVQMTQQSEKHINSYDTINSATLTTSKPKPIINEFTSVNEANTKTTILTVDNKTKLNPQPTPATSSIVAKSLEEIALKNGILKSSTKGKSEPKNNYIFSYPEKTGTKLKTNLNQPKLVVDNKLPNRFSANEQMIEYQKDIKESPISTTLKADLKSVKDEFTTKTIAAVKRTKPELVQKLSPLEKAYKKMDQKLIEIQKEIETKDEKIPAAKPSLADPSSLKELRDNFKVVYPKQSAKNNELKTSVHNEPLTKIKGTNPEIDDHNIIRKTYIPFSMKMTETKIENQEKETKKARTESPFINIAFLKNYINEKPVTAKPTIEKSHSILKQVTNMIKEELFTYQEAPKETSKKMFKLGEETCAAQPNVDGKVNLKSGVILERVKNMLKEDQILKNKSSNHFVIPKSVTPGAAVQVQSILDDKTKYKSEEQATDSLTTSGDAKIELKKPELKENDLSKVVVNESNSLTNRAEPVAFAESSVVPESILSADSSIVSKKPDRSSSKEKRGILKENHQTALDHVGTKLNRSSVLNINGEPNLQTPKQEPKIDSNITFNKSTTVPNSQIEINLKGIDSLNETKTGLKMTQPVTATKAVENPLAKSRNDEEELYKILGISYTSSPESDQNKSSPKPLESVMDRVRNYFGKSSTKSESSSITPMTKTETSGTQMKIENTNQFTGHIETPANKIVDSNSKKLASTTLGTPVTNDSNTEISKIVSQPTTDNNDAEKPTTTDKIKNFLKPDSNNNSPYHMVKSLSLLEHLSNMDTEQVKIDHHIKLLTDTRSNSISNSNNSAPPRIQSPLLDAIEKDEILRSPHTERVANAYPKIEDKSSNKENGTDNKSKTIKSTGKKKLSTNEAASSDKSTNSKKSEHAKEEEEEVEEEEDIKKSNKGEKSSKLDSNKTSSSQKIKQNLDSKPSDSKDSSTESEGKQKYKKENVKPLDKSRSEPLNIIEGPGPDILDTENENNNINNNINNNNNKKTTKTPTKLPDPSGKNNYSTLARNRPINDTKELAFERTPKNLTSNIPELDTYPTQIPNESQPPHTIKEVNFVHNQKFIKPSPHLIRELKHVARSNKNISKSVLEDFKIEMDRYNSAEATPEDKNKIILRIKYLIKAEPIKESIFGVSGSEINKHDKEPNNNS